MKTLVTGSGGFVGTHLVRALDELGWGPSLEPEVIINLASNSSVEQSINSPGKVIRDNVDVLINNLEYARIQSPKVFIHMSTVEAVRPTNPYAASKAAQEAICIAYRDTYKLPVVIVRSHNIVGEGQKPEKFVPKLVEKIKAGETIDIYGKGSRVYVPVETVVSALIYIAEHITQGTYLIGGGERLTNLAMAKKIAGILGIKGKYHMVKGRPGYARALRGEGKSIPGWKPPITLEEGLKWIR